MSVWQLQEAKSKFSQVINRTINGEIQEITKNGVTVAYIVSAQEYKSMQRPSLISVLESFPKGAEELILERNRDNLRTIEL